MDIETVERVKSLLLNLHNTADGQLWLQRMELSKFESATEQTYQPVVDFLELFNTTVRPIR